MVALRQNSAVGVGHERPGGATSSLDSEGDFGIVLHTRQPRVGVPRMDRAPPSGYPAGPPPEAFRLLEAAPVNEDAETARSKRTGRPKPSRHRVRAIPGNEHDMPPAPATTRRARVAAGSSYG